MSRARELAKVGGHNQQVIAGLSSHVGVSTFLNNVHMFANLDVGGNVVVTGTTTFNGGTLTLGDANTDNIVFGGEVDSHIIPDDDGTFDLGSSTKEWKDLYIDGTAHVDTLDVDENAGIIGNLTLTGNADFNGDLDVDGTTNLDVVDIDGAVDMASNLVIAGNIDANGNLDVDGTTDLDATNVVGTLTVTGDIAADNVTINGNTVSTSSGNLTLDSSGGTVAVSDNITVSGNGSVTGTFDVDGATTLDGLTVAEGAAFSSTLDVDGATTLDGLTVAEAAAFSAGVTITGALDANGGASIDNVQIGVTNNNEIDTSSGNLVIDSAGGTTTVDDNLTVSGNLTVNGTTTTINSTTVAIDDKNFQVATGSADDAAADGAGLTVDSGDGDKTWNFEATGDNWGASENINLASGKVLKVNNSQILSATALSSNVVVPNGSIPNSGVTAATYGSSTAIPILTVDAKGFVTSATTTAVDSTTIENGSASVAVASNGPITSTGNHDFTAGIDVTGNITVSGTVDGRDVASDGSKLDGIESSATADQTASEILTLIKTVDGSGSGLDADTLDGISSASFMRSDTSDTFTGTMTVSGNILPNANGTRDLGANGTRWANVYTSDIDLNNQAKGGNTIDQSWGSYLIEEGEHDLFLKNRRSGKTYKFMLQEV